MMFRLTCCVVALALSACISLQRDPPATRRFVLEVARPGEPATERSSVRLEVRQFHAAAAYADKKLTYRIAESEVESDFYHELLVPPGVAVAEVTRAWLSDSGRFATVHGASSAAAPDQTLHGDVLAMYGDYRGEPAAVLELHVTLVGPGGVEILFEQTLRERERIASATPVELIAGWRRALRRMLTELEGALAERMTG